MTDHDSPPDNVRPHLDAIKGHLEQLRKVLPQESITNLTVRLTDDLQMLVCYTDPETGKVICT